MIYIINNTYMICLGYSNNYQNIQNKLSEHLEQPVKLFEEFSYNKKFKEQSWIKLKMIRIDIFKHFKSSPIKCWENYGAAAAAEAGVQYDSIHYDVKYIVPYLEILEFLWYNKHQPAFVYFQI